MPDSTQNKTWFRFFYDKCTKFLFNMYNLCKENEQKLLVDQSIDSTKSICPPSSNVLSKRARFKWQIRYVLIVTSPFRVPLVHVAWNIWQARSSPAWCLVFRNCWWDSQTQKLLDIGCSCLLSVKKNKTKSKLKKVKKFFLVLSFLFSLNCVQHSNKLYQNRKLFTCMVYAFTLSNK